MATLKEALTYASQNPTSDFAKQLSQHIKTGAADTEARSLGIDLTPIKTHQEDLTQEVVKPQSSLMNRIVDSIKGTGQKIETTINDTSKNPIYQGISASAEGAMGVGKVLNEVVKTVPGVAKIEDVAGNIAGKVGKYVTDNKYLQTYSKDLEKSVGINNIQAAADVGNIANSVLGAKAGVDGITSTLATSAKAAKKVAGAVAPAIDTAVTQAGTILDRMELPNVSEATRVSLNPVEALKGTGQNMRITVGGKSKMVSELTPDEITKLKVSTTKSIDSFTKQAESFSKDRAVAGGSPVETVGTRTDNALQFADKKRQVIGNKMGEIETKYADTIIPVKDATVETFNNIKKLATEPSYGTNLGESPLVQKLVQDFDTLTQNGMTVVERNKFVRSWDSIIRDAKDPFGNFKENGSVYTKIQNAVNTVKTETVDALTAQNDVYRGLRKQYSEHIKLQDFGDSLLGKDGALGQKVKGAATVKRAIQSNSDAGARQFLTKLKDITGYDAIKDGDLALTAMKNVGDYQGLSLLNIFQDGKSGIIKKALEKGQEMIVGNESQRIKKYIKK